MQQVIEQPHRRTSSVSNNCGAEEITIGAVGLFRENEKNLQRG
jgi:hypothetical protein